MLVEIADLSGVERRGDQLDGGVPGIFAVHFAEDRLDIVMRVGKRLNNQANIFTAPELRAESAHQNVGGLAWKTGRNVQEVEGASPRQVDGLRRHGENMVR